MRDTALLCHLGRTGKNICYVRRKLFMIQSRMLIMLLIIVNHETDKEDIFKKSRTAFADCFTKSNTCINYFLNDMLGYLLGKTS